MPPPGAVLLVAGAAIVVEEGSAGLRYLTSPDEAGLFLAYRVDEPLPVDEVRSILYMLRALDRRPAWVPLWLCNRWISARLWLARLPEEGRLCRRTP